MKIKKWYVAVERDDGITEQLDSANLPSNVANFLEQYMVEVEQYRNEEKTK